MDYFMNLWLDAMTRAGFTAARWYVQATVGKPLGKESE